MTAPFTETGALGSVGELLVAPLIGFGFGWFLERGGLGHAPKLAGQFYLTDLTVFKVMFSALVTAMLGAFWLDQIGLLDLRLVYCRRPSSCRKPSEAWSSAPDSWSADCVPARRASRPPPAGSTASA